jgi:hypothetical protein
MINATLRQHVRRMGQPARGLIGSRPALASLSSAGTVAVLLVLLAGCQAEVAATASATRSGPGIPALRAGYPASFLGSVINGCGPHSKLPRPMCQGLGIFSSSSGRGERSIVGLKDAFSPEVLEHPHVVYYFTDGQGRNCSNLMRIPYRGGRPTLVRRFVGTALNSFAVSADGTMLAYQTFPQTNNGSGGACTLQDGSLLTVVNLVTGARHTITGAPDIFDMAWSKRGRELAIEYPHGPYAVSAVQVLVHPFAIARFTHFLAGATPPCPDRARQCLQFSPSYSADGQLFYLAGVAVKGSSDRGTEPPCGRTCRYVLTAVSGSRASALTSAIGENRSQASAWCTVSGPGNAAIITVPDGKAFATLRYANGHAVRLKYPVADVSW